MALLTPIRGLTTSALAFLATLTLTGTAIAEALPKIGVPEPGKMGFQPASSTVAVQAQALEGLVMWIITAITIFVCVLLLYVIVRYQRNSFVSFQYPLHGCRLILHEATDSTQRNKQISVQ